jgi:hypothetical protein
LKLQRLLAEALGRSVQRWLLQLRGEGLVTKARLSARSTSTSTQQVLGVQEEGLVTKVGLSARSTAKCTASRKRLGDAGTFVNRLASQRAAMPSARV